MNPPSVDDQGGVSKLLDAVLARPEVDRRAFLDRCCVEHPDSAEILRARFDALESFGLVGGDADDDEGFAPGTEVGPFEILERIGAGGMGIVYRAVQQPIGRIVALKVVRPEFATSPRQRQRFFREAEIVGQLDHPHIVPVFSAGELDGAPYLAMGFVEGITLAELIEAVRPEASATHLLDVVKRCFPQIDAVALERRIGGAGVSWPEVVASLLGKIADALAHAHARGIVHRDVKPSNIMIDAAARPVLLDFGLARADTDATLTRTGALIGSVPYMAPEQVRSGRVDARADVFAFGSVLFELARLRPAFDPNSAESAMREIVEVDPAGLHHARSPAERDLVAITAKCLEKSPSARYSSAEGLRNDLDALVGGGEIAAPRFGWSRRTLRFARRRPVRAVGIGVTGVALLACVMAIGIVIGQRDEAATGRARLDQLARDERVSLAYAALVDGDLETARASFERIAERWSDDPDGRLGLALVDRDWGSIPNEISRADREFLAATRLGPPPYADPVTAVARAQAAIAYAPRVRRLYQIGLAIAAGRAGDPAVAAVAANSLTELWPGSAAAAYWAGYALLDCDTATAAGHFDRAIALDPEFARAHASRGTAAVRLGDFDGAIRCLRRACALAPDVARTRINLGVALQHVGRVDDAIEQLRRATEIAPGLPGAHFALGNALFATDRTAAEAAFEATVAAAPGYARAWTNLGTLRLERFEHEAAIDAFRRVTVLEPGDADSFRDLAYAHAASGNAREAADAYSKVVSIAPRSRDDHDYLCSLLQHLGEHEALAAERARFTERGGGGQ